MPALRRGLAPRRRWRIWLAIAVIAVALLADWWRAPASQWSVRLYDAAILGGYRHILHPLTHRFVRCPYEPTCSRYSAEAMQLHGFPKGLWLTTWRLFRCMPGVRSGTADPVPLPRSATGSNDWH